MHEEIEMKIHNHSQKDEETLVLAAIRGDLEAFNQLVLTYQDLAYQQAYWLLGDSDSAADATQDSFIKAFQALHSFRGSSFRGWLLRIVTNSAYDILRRSHRHPTQPLIPEDEDGEPVESPPWLADPATSVPQAVEQRELSEEVRVLMDQLPKTYRDVLMLVDLYELDYAEAAEALHVPLGTVKSRLARARLQMRYKLERIEGFMNMTPGSTVCTAVQVL
jgi:RNA polymerase sigma-70 factor (ECF subfamily)